jgi:hypothetical protein
MFSATSKICQDSVSSVYNRAKSAQVFESPMSNDRSSFSAEKEHHSACTATQGIYEKLVLQISQEVAGHACDLEIAT